MYISVDFTGMSGNFTDITPKAKPKGLTLRLNYKDAKCLS